MNSSALEAGASGGEVYVYATGRAGISGNYVCRSVQASFWVQLTQPGVPQTVATNDSYTSIDVPSSCQSGSCTTTTATITVAGGSGGNGGTGNDGTGGTGGAGEEIQATFQIPVGMSLASDIGYEGLMAGNNTDPSTTISSITGSCSSSLPISSSGEICVGSTSGFNMPISMYVASSGGSQLVTCDTDTSGTFTNCTGGSGNLSVGGAVTQPWSTGYGSGGASGNPGGSYSYGGGYSSSGSGGGATAVCLEPVPPHGTGSCVSSTPLCAGATAFTNTSDCVLIVAAGGGGAGEGSEGGSAGNGGNGGSPSGAFPSTISSANELTTSQAESATDGGSSGGSGYASFGQSTGAAGGGQWVPSTTAASNTATGGSAGTSESEFGDSTPAGAPGQPNSSGSPATVTVPSMSGSHGGASGPAYGGDGCFWWCTGSDGGGGGGGLSGGGSGASGGDGGAGAGAGGASYFDVDALYTPTTACSSGPCLVVGTAAPGNGFANFTIQNVSNSTIPTAKTECLNDGGGGSYSPCSPTFDPDPTWYTVAPTSPCSTTCDSAGELESCGTAYTTEAPPGAYTGQAWLYGGGGGGGYGAATPGGSGGNGAAALVDFNAVPNDFYAVEMGCGGGGGGTSTAGAGVDGGGTGSSKTGGGGGATVLCFDGTSATASCSHTTAGCPVTSTTLASASAPCILAIVGGGGGGKTGAGAGGGPTGTGTSTTWCSTNSFTSYCNGNAGFNGTTAGSGGAGGASWFATSATGNTGPVESFSASGSEPCTSGTITSVTVSCLIDNSETSFPPATSLDTPCGGTGTAAYNNKESEDTSQSTNGGTAGAGEGCGGYSPTSAATGWQGYAGQLGYWGGAATSTATSYTAYYGWVNWTVYTPALESGACDFKSPAATPWGPPTPNSETISVPNTGTYTLTVGGGSGASGWETAGSGNFGNGGSGSELTFKATLTALQQLTVVAGCGGFGNLGGLGFGNGGSSGFQPQGTYMLQLGRHQRHAGRERCGRRWRRRERALLEQQQRIITDLHREHTALHRHRTRFERHLRPRRCRRWRRRRYRLRVQRVVMSTAGAEH